MSIESKRTETMAVCTAWCALQIEHTEDYETIKTILCVSDDHATAWKVFVDNLPNDIIGWQQRYHHWHLSDLEKIKQIIPDIEQQKYVVIDIKKHDYFKTEVVYMHHNWDEYENRKELTFEQKEALYVLFGADWDLTGSSSIHLQFNKVALVPVGGSK
jgi:hypothetical protein